MPKTPVDKNGYFTARIAYVWPSRDLPLQTISSKTRISESLPQHHLRLRVFPLVGFHGLCRMLIERQTFVFHKEEAPNIDRAKQIF